MQPWTTNSYAITPWLESLRQLVALDPRIVIPGQGPPDRDKAYLVLTTQLFESIVTQVHAAMESGVVTLPEVRRAVNLESLRAKFTHGDHALEVAFDRTTGTLIAKAYQEAHDGVPGTGGA